MSLIPFNRKNSVLSSTGFDDFYNMLDDFFGDYQKPSRSLVRDTFKIDVKETDTDYIIEAEMPGVKKEEVSLDIDERGIMISINRVEAKEEAGKNYIHRERQSLSLSRGVRLPNIMTDGVTAKLDSGVLTITATKKTKESKCRKISIE